MFVLWIRFEKKKYVPICSKWETTRIRNWNCVGRMSASFSVNKNWCVMCCLYRFWSSSVPLIMSGVLFLMKYVTAHTLGTSDDLRWPSFCEASRGPHCVHWNSNIFILYMWNWFLFRNVLTVVVSSAWPAIFHFSDHLTHAGSWNDWRSVLFPCILSQVFYSSVSWFGPFRSHLLSQLKLFDIYIRVLLQENLWAHSAVMEDLRNCGRVKSLSLPSPSFIRSHRISARVNVRVSCAYSCS